MKSWEKMQASLASPRRLEVGKDPIPVQFHKYIYDYFIPFIKANTVIQAGGIELFFPNDLVVLPADSCQPNAVPRVVKLGECIGTGTTARVYRTAGTIGLSSGTCQPSAPTVVKVIDKPQHEYELSLGVNVEQESHFGQQLHPTVSPAVKREYIHDGSDWCIGLYEAPLLAGKEFADINFARLALDEQLRIAIALIDELTMLLACGLYPWDANFSNFFMHEDPDTGVISVTMPDFGALLAMDETGFANTTRGAIVSRPPVKELRSRDGRTLAYTASLLLASIFGYDIKKEADQPKLIKGLDDGAIEPRFKTPPCCNTNTMISPHRYVKRIRQAEQRAKASLGPEQHIEGSRQIKNCQFEPLSASMLDKEQFPSNLVDVQRTWIAYVLTNLAKDERTLRLQPIDLANNFREQLFVLEEARKLRGVFPDIIQQKIKELRACDKENRAAIERLLSYAQKAKNSRLKAHYVTMVRQLRNLKDKYYGLIASDITAFDESQYRKEINAILQQAPLAQIQHEMVFPNAKQVAKLNKRQQKILCEFLAQQGEGIIKPGLYFFKEPCTAIHLTCSMVKRKIRQRDILYCLPDLPYEYDENATGVTAIYRCRSAIDITQPQHLLPCDLMLRQRTDIVSKEHDAEEKTHYDVSRFKPGTFCHKMDWSSCGVEERSVYALALVRQIRILLEGGVKPFALSMENILLAHDGNIDFIGVRTPVTREVMETQFGKVIKTMLQGSFLSPCMDGTGIDIDSLERTLRTSVTLRIKKVAEDVKFCSEEQSLEPVMLLRDQAEACMEALESFHKTERLTTGVLKSQRQLAAFSAKLEQTIVTGRCAVDISMAQKDLNAILKATQQRVASKKAKGFWGWLLGRICPDFFRSTAEKTMRLAVKQALVNTTRVHYSDKIVNLPLIKTAALLVQNGPNTVRLETDSKSVSRRKASRHRARCVGGNNTPGGGITYPSCRPYAWGTR